MEPYAAPARAVDLTGLPSVVTACEFDPMRDEAIAYAARLTQAGVGVELRAGCPTTAPGWPPPT